MQTIDVEIRLPIETMRALKQLAQDRDVSTGQVIRAALAREISRVQHRGPSIRADEELIARLRAHLAGDLASAVGWTDLEARLKTKGYVLRAAGGGLALHSWPDDERVCKASDLGFSYSKLMHRFREAFPGHPHTWLAARLDDVTINKASPTDEDDAQDFQVIEPF